MYYYITEPCKNNSEKRTQERIKFILGELGIAGETVNVSHARPIKEAVKMGILKGYKTMVAIGSDWLANQAASYLCGRDVTLGIVPIDPEQEISDLINAKDVKEACEALKYRKVEVTNLGFIEPNRLFLTPAKINEIKATSMEINWNHCRVQSKITDLVIDRNLNLKIWDKKNLRQSAGFFFRWLIGKDSPGKNSTQISVFRSPNFKVTTSQIIPLKVAGRIIAKTPFTARLASGVLPIIVSRDKLKIDNK